MPTLHSSVYRSHCWYRGVLHSNAQMPASSPQNCPQTSGTISPVDESVAHAVTYPGRMLSQAALLREHGLDPWPSGSAPRAREPVLAIGSNASPSTLRRKLARAGVSVQVAMEPALALGMGVAHSAHVSTGGYVAAAPFHDPSRVARGVLLWLDSAQLLALDRSEPNYTRVTVPSSRYPLVTRRRTALLTYGVYRSAWGVLTTSGHVVRLRSQRRLHELLRREGLLIEQVPVAPTRDAVLALRDPWLQARMRSSWARRASATDGIRTVG